jgi:hypothetical protein
MYVTINGLQKINVHRVVLTNSFSGGWWRATREKTYLVKKTQ